MIASVTALLFLVLLVLAIAAMRLFASAYHHGCVDSLGRLEPMLDYQDEFGCGGTRACPAGYTCQVRAAAACSAAFARACRKHGLRFPFTTSPAACLPVAAPAKQTLWRHRSGQFALIPPPA